MFYQILTAIVLINLYDLGQVWYLIVSIPDLYTLTYFPIQYITYPTIHKVNMQAGAITYLLYGCAYVREITHKIAYIVRVVYSTG